MPAGDREPDIDRDKHDVDLLEHVFKGVHTQSEAPIGQPHVVKLTISPWSADQVVCAVHVRVMADDDERNRHD